MKLTKTLLSILFILCFVSISIATAVLIITKNDAQKYLLPITKRIKTTEKFHLISDNAFIHEKNNEIIIQDLDSNQKIKTPINTSNLNDVAICEQYLAYLTPENKIIINNINQKENTETNLSGGNLLWDKNNNLIFTTTTEEYETYNIEKLYSYSPETKQLTELEEFFISYDEDDLFYQYNEVNNSLIYTTDSGLYGFNYYELFLDSKTTEEFLPEYTFLNIEFSPSKQKILFNTVENLDNEQVYSLQDLNSQFKSTITFPQYTLKTWNDNENDLYYLAKKDDQHEAEALIRLNIKSGEKNILGFLDKTKTDIISIHYHNNKLFLFNNTDNSLYEYSL